MTGILGLVIGSFLNVVIYRLPLMLERAWQHEAREILGEGDTTAAPRAEAETFNLATPRSACPACGAPVRAWQNIPILSFLLLRGRCAACGAAIPLRYPLVEGLTGILSAIVAWRYGATPECAGALMLTWALIALAMIDLDHQLLPDAITLPLLWLGLALSLWASPASPGALFPYPREAIAGALAGYLSLWSIYKLFKLVTGKEGMGYGDFKLLAALGAWLGWQMLPVVILMSAAVGAAVGIGLVAFTRHARETPIPFGPYLAAAGFVATIWGPELMAAWLGLLRP